MRISVLAFGLGFTALLGPACSTSSPDDELATEDADSEGKGDAASGLYTYYHLTADLRKCAAPVCGGVYVDRVNRSKTRCATGREEDTCYAADVDWAQAGLGAVELDKVSSALATTGTPVRVLVRGHLETKGWGEVGDFGHLVVTEAWIAQTESDADGVFAYVKDTGLRCIQSPCESFIEQKLNSALEANIAGIDFAPSGAEEPLVTTAYEHMGMERDGVIVAGWRDYEYGPAGHARTRTAEQFYFRLGDAEPAPAPCYVGGCSGQVCSDQEGVITTCEWLPEYACYDAATCERQSDGTCGWTQTDELLACLADPPGF